MTQTTAAKAREQIQFCADAYMQVRPGSRAAAEIIKDQQFWRVELAAALRAERTTRRGDVTEADIQAGREHIADVHNTAQMFSACGQLRREVLIEMADLGLVPSIYGSGKLHSGDATHE
jgi:hypothetical protein